MPNGSFSASVAQVSSPHFSSSQVELNGSDIAYRQLHPSQDEMANYIFPVSNSESDFDLSSQQQSAPPTGTLHHPMPHQPPMPPKYPPMRWPLNEQSIDYSANEQVMFDSSLNGPTRLYHSGPPPPNVVQASYGPGPQQPPHHGPMPPMVIQQPRYHSALQQQQQFQHQNHHYPRNQIASSTKKLWGVDEVKEDVSKGILNINGNDIPCSSVWRDSTWSTSDHSVSQPMTMVPRRSGSFPAGAENNILSPRSSETGGLGVKMVEYVLGTSPTKQDLEPRMRGLGLSSAESSGPEMKKEKENNASPYENVNNNKKDMENGNCSAVVQQNGIVMLSNGLDDDKAFNRTPGSRQPSPTDEELNKNGASVVSGNSANVNNPGPVVGVVNNGVATIVENLHPQNHQHHQQHSQQHHHHNHQNNNPHHQQQQQPPQQIHHHHHHSILNHHGIPLTAMHPAPPPPPPPPPPHINQIDSLNQPFEQILNIDPNAFDHQHVPSGHSQLNHVHSGLDSTNTMMQPSYDAQLFRTHQQQQQQHAAAAAVAAAAAAATAPTQLSLLQQQQQQQFLQPHQHLTGPPTAGLTTQAFTTAPAPQYIINTQDQPYVITGAATMVPQYYSLPWSVYPANIIQPNSTANGQPRRPITPSSVSGDATNNLSAAAGAVQPAAAAAAGQYQVIPTYYDQNGSLVMRGLSNGTTMRLVSPAPVLVNPTTPGVQDVSVGLGLNNNETSTRVDSFDRNNSTAYSSPSLDYARPPPKWPQTHQTYGTLGASITACQSPLSLQSAPLSPPPTLGSATGLHLGTLMANATSPNSRNSNTSNAVAMAGPDAMAKLRSAGMCTPIIDNLTANGTIFGPAQTVNANSLLAKFNVRANGGSSLTTPANIPVVDSSRSAVPRSRLLEEFRNSRLPNLTIRDIQNHMMEFSQDQHGSRFIQQKLERASNVEKQMVFAEISGSAVNLMTDVFGNYVIQKFFEFGTVEQKTFLAQKVQAHAVTLALQMYGCRVIQKALECITTDLQIGIATQLENHIIKCIKDQNGNHVVQKCIECIPADALDFVIKPLVSQVFSLSTHPYGCRVIQRILEHCTPQQTVPILAELHAHTEQLIQDQYGNYVIQHVLERGNIEDKSRIISAIKGKMLILSQHKFASNVVEKCVTNATRSERAALVDEICNLNDSGLQIMMKDQYANYVVQKMLDVCEPNQRKVLMSKIRPYFGMLRKFTYGKHIISKMEKYFSKTANGNAATTSTTVDLGPIGPPPPTNGML